MNITTEYQKSFDTAVETLLLIDKKRRKQQHTSEDCAKCVSDLDILLTRSEEDYCLTFLKDAFIKASRRNGNSLCLDESVCIMLSKLEGPIGIVHRMAAMNVFFCRYV